MEKFSFSKKYNTERLFDIDTTDFEYISLKELYEDEEKVYTVHGVYINTKGLFDDAPVVAISNSYVNLPAHMTAMCKEMLNDKQAIDAINNGEVGFTIYKYVQKTFNRDCYSIRWVDIEPLAE